jgi:glycosyltransferase involved in cell wall biosynthesis
MMDAGHGGNPAVAVITRTKDRAALLDRAVGSVLAQSMDRLHLVIVNDGGDPAPVDAVVAAHADRAGGRISVLHRAVSGGMESASNAGIGATRSDWIALLDDDDRWDPHFLERTMAAAEHVGAAGAVADATVVLERLVAGAPETVATFPFDPTPGAWMTRRPPTDLYRLIGWNQFPPCAFVYRRAVIDEIGGYDESLPVLGDWEFNLRFFARHPVVHVAEPLAFYHHRVDDDPALANSVHAGEDLHERVRLEILQRSLRADLEKGALGVGTLANLLYDLRQDRTAMHQSLEKLHEQVQGLNATISVLADRVDRSTEAQQRNGNRPAWWRHWRRRRLQPSAD